MILDKQNPQGVGSALTYAKRQILQAMWGLSAGPEEDDDGNAASILEEDDNPQGKLTSKSAYSIAKVAMREINSLEALTEWKKVQPDSVKNNANIRELVKGKESELRLAV